MPLEQRLNELSQSLSNALSKDDDSPESIQALSIYITQVIIQVVEYCNIEYDELNVPLLLQCYYMLSDQLYNDSLMGSNGAGDVKSVREGDVTVQRVTLIDKVNALSKRSNLISDYYNVLNKYRRIRV